MPCPQISGRIFFGQISCKIWAFSVKYHVNFGNIVNFLGKYVKFWHLLIFHTHIFRQKCLAPQKLSDLQCLRPSFTLSSPLCPPMSFLHSILPNQCPHFVILASNTSRVKTFSFPPPHTLFPLINIQLQITHRVQSSTSLPSSFFNLVMSYFTPTLVLLAQYLSDSQTG